MHIDTNPHVLSCENTNKIYDFIFITSQEVKIFVTTSTTLNIARQVTVRTSLVHTFK